MRVLILIAATAIAGCSPQPSSSPENTTAPPLTIPACNDLTPDFTRMVRVQDETNAALSAAELLGGPIPPGTYDLSGAVRVGAATGWNGERAVVLSVSESDTGVVLNWAGAARGEAIDKWTATLADRSRVQITYTCGRIGEVNASYLAQPDALSLRIEDGASGTLHLVFDRRS